MKVIVCHAFPWFICTAKPLLFVSVAVSHFSNTLSLFVLVAVNDLKFTGNGAQTVEGNSTTVEAPVDCVITRNRSSFAFAGGMLPVTVICAFALTENGVLALMG